LLRLLPLSVEPFGRTPDYGPRTEPTTDHGPRTTDREPATIFTNMIDATQQQGLVTRLNRIEGQVRGIRRMVQESRRCLEILQQLAAAEAALNRVSLAVLKVHVEGCVPAAAAEGSEPQAKALAELVDIFDRFAR
jgi:CsoR family transcriptional regulator, copper-sensing transcriptional repressor